jgi:phosphoribosyl 1,2-cyclic phosphodiesterase
LQVTFWGVRGSAPISSSDTVQVGGNTSCVQITLSDGTPLLLDAGTGLARFGDAWKQASTHFHLLLSHAHWDHIQGFPFFAPAYLPEHQISVYGPCHEAYSLQAILAQQMKAPFFPVEISTMQATLSFRELGIERFEIAGAQITTAAFHHPGGVLGFRIEEKGKTVVFATDMEYTHDAIPEHLVDFVRDADLLIFDAQYTPEELSEKQGWGHSTHLTAAHLAAQAGVKQVMLYHHDPSHHDAALFGMEKEAQAIFSASFLACEGLQLNLDQLPSP